MTKYLNNKKYDRYMESEDIEKSLGTIKEFSEYVKKSERAYGLAWAAFGLIILGGFVIMQLLLHIVEWNWIVFGIFITLGAAFTGVSVISLRIERKIGKARSWIGVNVNGIWRLAIVGGFCLNLVASITLSHISRITDVEMLCYVLLGWFVVVGMGASATGVLTSSKGMTITGIVLMVSIILIALYALEYAFLTFGIILGVGYMVTGFANYGTGLKRQ